MSQFLRSLHSSLAVSINLHFAVLRFWQACRVNVTPDQSGSAQVGFTCMLRPAFGVSASSVRLGWAAALKSLILLVSVILSFSQYLPYLPCNFQFSLSSFLCSAKIYHLDPCPHPPLSCGLSSIVPITSTSEEAT